MSDDIRSLITSGSRAKVAPRDASINSNIDKTIPGESLEEANDIEQQEISSSDQIEKLETELSQLPENGKRLAINLEKELRNKFVSFCNREEITPETFVEASLFILEQHPEIKSDIAVEARSRLLVRKRAGFIRRTISMLKVI